MPTLFTSPAVAVTVPHADAAVQVTATPDPARAHATPALAVDPKDRNVLAVAEGDARSARCGLWITVDGGLTWQEAANPQPPEWPQCVYGQFGPIADVTFSPDGTLYYALVGQRLPNTNTNIFLARSTDLGRTFSSVQLTKTDPSVRPRLEQTDTNGFPEVIVNPRRPQEVYVLWQSNYKWAGPRTRGAGVGVPSRPFLASSQDGGATFSQPMDLGPDIGTLFSTDPHMAVGTDGTLYVFFGEYTVAEEGAAKAEDVRLWMASSRDGGRTFTRTRVRTIPGGVTSGWVSSPAPAVNPGTGDLYLVWEELGEATQSVQFMRSADNGRTWTSPAKINEVDPKRKWPFNEMYPWMSVAPNGRIDVAWYDWRNDITDPAPDAPYGGLQDVYYTYSTDRGRTWAKNLKVTDRAIDRRIGVWGNNIDLRGPIGLVSTNDRADISWDDSRNGGSESQSQDIYFTRVRFSAGGDGGVDRGVPDLAWAVGGAAVALALAGLALFVATRRASRAPSGS